MRHDPPGLPRRVGLDARVLLSMKPQEGREPSQLTGQIHPGATRGISPAALFIIPCSFNRGPVVALSYFFLTGQSLPIHHPAMVNGNTAVSTM